MSVTNFDDNDAAGIHVMPVTGLVTSESGGSAAFSVVLTSQPLSDVTIATSSSDTSEGTVAPESLVFTHENWNVSQQVTVTGADDAIDDGDVLYNVLTAPASSTDGKYHGLNAMDPAVTNEDNDTAGITVVAGPNLRTTESGGTAQFTVVLDTQPTTNVRIPFSSSNPNEGATSIQGVTFTPNNWNSVQTVTITGVDDAIVDGDVAYTIDISAANGDPTYLGLQPVPTVPVVNEDNDTASVILTPENGTRVVEGGATASVAVELGSQPSGNVTVSLSVSPSSQATLSTNSLTFAPGSGTIPQDVTVTAVDDTDPDGDQAFTITATVTSTADPNYSGLSDNATGVAEDNEQVQPGVIVTPTSGLQTTESADIVSTSFTVRLASAPTSSVLIQVTSSDTTEGTITGPGGQAPGGAVAAVSLTPLNWSTGQVITVFGVDEQDFDGDITYAITLGPTQSSDPNYNGLTVPSVSVTNIDNEEAPTVGRFNGSYVGSYTGTTTGPGIDPIVTNGPLAFTITDGVVAIDGGGSGTLADDGTSDFISTGGSVDGCTFDGGFSTDGVNAGGSGTFFCDLGSGFQTGGSWQATRVSSLHADVEPLVSSLASSLTIEQASATAELASRLWYDEEDSNILEEAKVLVVDLPGLLLAQAGSGVIYLDHNAAGHGWFIDATPGEHEEFTLRDGVYQALGDSDADGKIDLLTVLAHEMGHLLGYGDLDSDLHTDDIMADTLPPGARRLPWAEAVDHALGEIR